MYKDILKGFSAHLSGQDVGHGEVVDHQSGRVLEGKITGVTALSLQ